MVTKLWNGKRHKTYVDLILDDITSFIPNFSRLLYSHVKKAGNIVAHLLAKLNPGASDPHIFCNDFYLALLH